MALYKIQKRNGTIVTFDRLRIENALAKAIEAVGGSDFTEVMLMTDEVIALLESRIKKSIPHVEQIQDLVEEILVKKGHDTVAKAYILYRKMREESREDTRVMVEVGKTMEEYLDKSDWRVNANANSGYSLGGLILNTS